MKAVLLDIEGTVSDKRFVTTVLFPYARERMAEFLRANAYSQDVAPAMRAMIEKIGRRDASIDDIAAELVRWIDEDRKEEPLKTLQGLIWAEGYKSGALVSHIYPDVPPMLERWLAAGTRIAIFSSGSIAAQKLLFAHTEKGDLTPLLDGYFDLSTGPKFEAASYLKIAKALDLPPAEIRFYSDVIKEIEGARGAGMDAVLVERDGPIAGEGAFRRVQTFAGE